jgi:hypothetical protein
MTVISYILKGVCFEDHMAVVYQHLMDAYLVTFLYKKIRSVFQCHVSCSNIFFFFNEVPRKRSARRTINLVNIRDHQMLQKQSLKLLYDA